MLFGELPWPTPAKPVMQKSSNRFPCWMFLTYAVPDLAEALLQTGRIFLTEVGVRAWRDEAQHLVKWGRARVRRRQAKVSKSRIPQWQEPSKRCEGAQRSRQESGCRVAQTA